MAEKSDFQSDQKNKRYMTEKGGCHHFNNKLKRKFHTLPACTVVPAARHTSPLKGLRYIHIYVFANNKKGFKECINKIYFPFQGCKKAEFQTSLL